MQSPYVSMSEKAEPLPTPTNAVGLDPTFEEELNWKSVVVSHKLTLEHAAIDINTDRVLYHMELVLDSPLPKDALRHTQYIGLTWPYGGLWKIERVSADRTQLDCLAWRKTDLTPEQVIELAKEVDQLAKQLETSQELTSVDEDAQPGDRLPTLFEWKMMRGEWNNEPNHWFIRDVEPPVIPVPQPTDRLLVAKLFVGFQALEARIDVNAVTAIDTVAQTYSADVTWQVMLPAITALREDMALREFLDLLEIDAEQFEFTNINEIHEMRDLNSSVTPAGDVQFRDLTVTVDHPPVTEPLYHLVFRRRVVASFTEEMALHHFPFDRQKLAFDFSTGSMGMPNEMLRLMPVPVNPGSFSIENFQLGNVFNVAYHNKVFVCELQETGPKKSMSFEMVVERRSMYYLTNVALISAIITYLCFITWAPLEDGSFMDPASRLQIVTALVLTAVTFKNQVASLIPQISYFSMLDSYVFVCFIVTCLVTLENAFFAGISQWFKNKDGKVDIDESSFLAISVGAFTTLNVVWGLYVHWWLRRRRYAAQVLHQVHEYICVISDAIPTRYRKAVLMKYLEEKKYPAWSLPSFTTTMNGDIHIQAPDDRPSEDHLKQEKQIRRFRSQKEHAKSEAHVFKRILKDLRPSIERLNTAPITLSPAVRKEMTVLQAGRMFNPRVRRRISARSAADYEHSQGRALSLEEEHIVEIPAFQSSLVGRSNSARVA